MPSSPLLVKDVPNTLGAPATRLLSVEFRVKAFACFLDGCSQKGGLFWTGIEES